ncbi:translesion error-prone DNA polymerase V subunit UmuC [Mixta calida]|uniref:Translesion error-prone DNA polymerase V subunit UmuC n=1 Tax=Mixta calida TaxID=665913 RepID=A0ABM6S228_9GAMM|nr:translesion error-prone DNA polymerase V subunit UmuC [Mixta calida]AIX74027.1 DNA polymerase V subunit UmuC [Pantoea sp. PSNIH2]MDU3817960.1 translesion error-prone DNA polymerase V subunit UmuC [Pantoea sp.]POU43175.1 translesion error-prone DNA polymerase V subunit UmuC [Pantoea sp. PSNIH5]POU61460.1 translesion error-prone DNA polymerase V subunit UmuC [Pantoea sp. PSNIH4]POY66246.1 translesion error-prone DNA polymerase V subunit UmuC [Pantoea sp. PSNIH3]
MFALVDVNNFYASCEMIFRPDLADRPVIVLSNNDGCVISRNALAKQAGIAMAAPYFMIQESVRQHGIEVFSSNYALYGDMSSRVMSLLEELAPRVEIYSIDEAFIDLHGVSHCMSLEQFGHQLRDRVRKEAHLKVGVGIACTRTLAKLANYAAKRWPQLGGVVDLSDSTRQRKLLARVPVEEVWGVGRRISQRLRQLGIETALQLAESPAPLIRKHFSVVLERTVRELRGESCLAAEEVPSAKQQIVCSRSFGSRTDDYQAVRQAVCAWAERAAEKLRKEKQYCRQVAVFLRTSPHAADGRYYANQASGQLLTPTNDTREIIRLATEGLDRIWRDGYRYIKTGVILSDFFSQGVAQLDLFDEHRPQANGERLMKLMDEINQRGKGKLWFAGQGIVKPWTMKREMLSPTWTTRWSDIPVARIK